MKGTFGLIYTEGGLFNVVKSKVMNLHVIEAVFLDCNIKCRDAIMHGYIKVLITANSFE